MADTSPHADPETPFTVLTPGTLAHLVAVIKLLADDLEHMRANGHPLGTTVVGRTRSIAGLASRVRPDEAAVTIQQVWEAYTAARFVSRSDVLAPDGESTWVERGRVLAMLADLGVPVEVPRV